MVSPSSPAPDTSFEANAPGAAAKAAKRDLEKISVSLTGPRCQDAIILSRETNTLLAV
jgi:hypothetical protein